jgi:hypothetical protein
MWARLCWGRPLKPSLQGGIDVGYAHVGEPPPISPKFNGCIGGFTIFNFCAIKKFISVTMFRIYFYSLSGIYEKQNRNFDGKGDTKT